MSIICEYHSIKKRPKLLRSCSLPNLSSLFLGEPTRTVARWPSECTNAERTHPRAARGFSDRQWVSCSPFRAITMYQSIHFARGKTGKVKNDAMPPKVGRVASDGKRVFEPSHLRLDGIVPLSMKGIAEEVESSKFLVGDFQTGGIGLVIFDSGHR